MVDTFSILTDSDSLEPNFALADPGRKKLVIKESVEENIVTIEKIMSATEVSSKVHLLSLYEKAISYLMHARQWKEVIEDKIQNLENYQTWEYDNLPDNRKAVGSKWVLKKSSSEYAESMVRSRPNQNKKRKTKAAKAEEEKTVGNCLR